MEFASFDIEGLLQISPSRIGDDRGFFSESFRSDRFCERVGEIAFVQDNHARSARRGTVRGLHFQREPLAQGKLIRVTRGAALDVAVDVRHGSPTFGRHVAIELSAANWRQLWAPTGFLHGYCTLEDDTEIVYKVTEYYSAAHDAAVLWNDPDLKISWPVNDAEAVLSERDRAAPRLRDLPPMFPYAAHRRAAA